MSDAIPLHIEELTKTFRKSRPKRRKPGDKPKNGIVTALGGVSLEVQPGEIYGLLGPNGCGKSTLVRIVSTLLLPDQGRASVFGRDVVREAGVVRRLVNRVSVDAAFFKKLSPAENLLYAARLYGVPPRDGARKAREILEGLGFPLDRFGESMENLSRGQQQKVAIARGLFTSPVLLLLDEPTTGLDPRSKREVEVFIRGATATYGATVLFTTHDMIEAERLCDRLGIMNEGKLIEEGTCAELKARHPAPEKPETTLEDVFMKLTGKSLEAAESDAAEKAEEE